MKNTAAPERPAAAKKRMKELNAILTSSSARVLAALALGCLCLLSCRKASTFEPEPEPQGEASVVTLRITAGETPATRSGSDEGGAYSESPAGSAVILASSTAAALANTSPATRAETETDDAGVSFENCIDISSTHILFFIDDKFSEEFIPEAVEPVGSATYPTEWKLRGPILNPPAAGFKVAVLANCTLPALTAGVSTIEDLCKSAVYTAYAAGATEAFEPSASSLIPMYGVQTYATGLTFRPRIATDLGQIDLLRAMSKVIVRNTSGKTLSSATLKGYNLQGTVAPLSLYTRTSDWTHANTYDRLAKCLAVHLPSEATANETSSSARSVSLIQTSKTATEEVWTGYFPEYLNANTDGDALSDRALIDLAFDGLSAKYSVDFRYYASPSSADDGKRFDLKRNHIYEFDITKVDAYSLSMTVIAKPWDVKNHSYSYDENVTVKDTGKQTWHWVADGSEVAKDTGNDHKMTFPGLGDIKLSFTIDTPLEAEWIAVFEQKSGDLNHFYFESTGTDRATGIVDGNQTDLIIKQRDSNGSAKLVIYVHYGNISFKASAVLGGEYTLEKY